LKKVNRRTKTAPQEKRPLTQQGMGYVGSSGVEVKRGIVKRGKAVHLNGNAG